ncbi:MAG TPA: RHS repeat-associated core domain-containing protein [Gemmatimonadaceae bacterium]|nr:RHS repeat-associated core domain-containing protein [Gemmatimonadaceae bacterium]
MTAQYPSWTESFVDSTQHMLVVNERTSKVAKGWTISGVPHLYVQSDGAALITDGSGSATYFDKCGPSCFTTPHGDFSTLTVHGAGDSTVYTRAYPDASTVLFNNIGQATAQVGRLPDTVSFSYDSTGRLTEVTDPFRTFTVTCFDCPGGTTTLHYGIGLFYGGYGLDSIQEPGLTPATVGRVTHVTIGSDSTLQTITDPDGVGTKFRYDTRFRLTTIIDRRGDTTSYTYRSDSSWKLASIASPNVPTDLGGGNTSLQRPTLTVTPWQIASVPTGLTATTPATPALTDSVQAVVVDPGGHRVRFTVDRWGQPLRTTGPLGLVTTITRSGIFAVKTVSPTGAADSAAYNSSGLLIYDEPAGQNPTTLTYDAHARPTRIAVPGHATETFTYGKYGADSLASIVGADSSIRYFVDALGRDTMVVDPAGHTTTAHYESRFGNLDSTTAPGDRWTKRVFDRYGRDSLQLANGVPADTTTYDAMNRVARVATPGLGATSMSYDAMFQTRLKDPKGNVYRVSVDALGRVSKRYDPADTLNRYGSYRYNLDGLLTSYTDRRAQRVDFAYDSLHRKLAKTGSGVVPDSFSYNPMGTITVGWNAASRDSIFANSLGLTDSVVTWLEPANKRFRRSYHRVTGTTLVDSVHLKTTSPIIFANRNYGWNDTTGLLSKISSSAPQANYAIPTYTPDLLDSTITWAGTVTNTLAHTSRHELMASQFNVAAINAALERSYSYADSLGHITQMSRLNGSHGEIRHYAYTPAGALGAEEVDSLTSGTSCPPPVGQQLYNDGYSCMPLSGFTALHEFGFTYDSAGNRLESRDSVPNTVATGTYTTGNRLTGWGFATYTRDLDGNDSTKTIGTHVTTYNWTADGRLTSVTAGTVKLTYTYDAFGQLIQRSRSINGGAAVLERQFLWDQGQLLAELDSSATRRIAEYQYWPGTDQPYALFTGADSITATRFFMQDPMNNVTGVFTTTGVSQSLVYEPFGMIDSSHSSFSTLADTSRLRWKGLMYEGDSTRLYYVRNRWYDAQSGRFLTEDPSGLQGGLDLYVFGGDDPIDAIDPQGLEESGNSCAFVDVTIEDLVDGQLTQSHTKVQLCSGDGSVIGQILDYAATQGVGQGSAVWGGGVFATGGGTGAFSFATGTAWPTLVGMAGILSELQGCPEGNTGIMGTAYWGVDAGNVSFQGTARFRFRVPAIPGLFNVPQGVYYIAINVTGVTLPTQRYVGIGQVDCTTGAGIFGFGIPRHSSWI